MLKVAIVGCGKIADSHVSQIQRISGCEIVGVCDRESLMARQLQERFGLKESFSDLSALLQKARPDVVHVTTPPQSHFAIARQCLEQGCHVYVEKPFTLHAQEAEQLLEFAAERKLKMTVGHDAQFSHAAQQLRQLVKDGYLGGDVVHMESYYGYEFGSVYGNALLEDKQHWVRGLPGKLLHNVISHGIARIAEFLLSPEPQVIAYGFVSPLLRQAGEREIIDELRVIIVDEQRTTAYFTFSSQMRPSLHQFRLYGLGNGLLLDESKQILLKLRGQRYKSYAERFVPALGFARQYLSNFANNTRLFLASEFHFDVAKKHLIEAFYRAIRDEAPLPISPREILLTARIMESIFNQLRETRTRMPLPVRSHELPAARAI
jgi:predicted dehydrogenase